MRNIDNEPTIPNGRLFGRALTTRYEYSQTDSRWVISEFLGDVRIGYVSLSNQRDADIAYRLLVEAVDGLDVIAKEIRDE